MFSTTSATFLRIAFLTVTDENHNDVYFQSCQLISRGLFAFAKRVGIFIAPHLFWHELRVGENNLVVLHEKQSTVQDLKIRIRKVFFLKKFYACTCIECPLRRGQPITHRTICMSLIQWKTTNLPINVCQLYWIFSSIFFTFSKKSAVCDFAQCQLVL